MRSLALCDVLLGLLVACFLAIVVQPLAFEVAETQILESRVGPLWLVPC